MENHVDLDAVHRLREAFLQITHELSKVVIGQKEVIEELLVAMFARGHCLFVGVQGMPTPTLADRVRRGWPRR